MTRKIRAVARILFILKASLVLNLILLLLPCSSLLRAKIASFFFRIILLGCGIEIHSSKTLSKPEPNKRLLIVANHVSYLDILIVCSLHPCVFLAKSEVAQWPVFGWVAQAMGCVFVKRDSLMGRACALRRSLAAHKVSSIAIFPEGTTTAAAIPNTHAWTKGHAWIAQRSNIDAILCLGLAFENQEERAWTDDISLMPHLLRTLGEPRIRVNINETWTQLKTNQHTNSLAEATLQGVCIAVNHAYSR